MTAAGRFLIVIPIEPIAYRRRVRLLLLLALLVAAAGGMRAQTAPRQAAPRQAVEGNAPDSVYLPGSIGRVDTTQRDTLPGITRLRRDARLDSLELAMLLDSLDNTTQARWRRNLAMVPSDWMPTQAERDAREAELRRAMDMDFVFPNSYVKLFGISTGAVFRALGLIDDVTPRINYVLMRTERVSVKIYTLRATLVATLVDATQRPGEYDFEWDLLDASGARVPYGNYVAEVIVGNQLVLRKRIEAP